MSFGFYSFVQEAQEIRAMQGGMAQDMARA